MKTQTICVKQIILAIILLFFVHSVGHSQTVGIGSSSFTPQSTLDVKGNMTIGSTYGGTNAAPANGLLVEGNVGIGTTNPGYRLDVQNTSTATSGNNYLAQHYLAINPGSASSGSYSSAYNLGLISGSSSISGVVYGSFNWGYNNNSGTLSQLIGSYNVVNNVTTGTITNAYGIESVTGNLSTGTITTAYGELSAVQNISTGGITTAYDIYLRTDNTNASGTIGTNYGAYIAAPIGAGTISSKYAFVSEAGAGNVGIGTTAPGLKLDIVPSASNDGVRVLRIGSGAGNGQLWGLQTQNAAATDGFLLGSSSSTYTTGGTIGWIGNSQGFLYYPADFRVGTGVGATPTMVFTTGGNVGIGTTANDTKLIIQGEGTGSARIGGGTGCGGNYTGISLNGSAFSACANYNLLSSPTDQNLYICRPTGNQIQIREGVTAQVIIMPTSGNVGIGGITPDKLLTVNGAADNTTGVWAVYSDRRLKNNIEPLQNALSTVMRPQGVAFNWNDSTRNAQLGRVRGFIAQDVEKVIPEWVHTQSNGYKQLETIGVDALLVEAIKEQEKKFYEQQKIIEQLQMTVLELKKYLKKKE